MEENFIDLHPAVNVLILIVMEDTHGDRRSIFGNVCKVLILIVMEDTHGVHKIMRKNFDPR